MSVTVPLTRGYVATVDEADLSLVSPYRWYADERSGRVYARTNMNGHTVRMHRFILGIAGSRPELDVDHRNRDALDNRRSNLRTCTRTENMRNQRHKQAIEGRPTRSRFKGLEWNEKGHTWSARICVNGKQRGLGSFVTERDAALAYDDAARAFFGEYAATNAELGLLR